MIKIETRRWFLIKEIVNYLCHLLKHNADINTEKSIEKMQYTILRSTHVIEKGLSLRTPRKAFGKEKILALLHNANKYMQLYGTQDKTFLIYPLSVISQYINHETTIGANVEEVETALKQIVNKYSFQLPQNTEAGVKLVSRTDIVNASQADFASLLSSRHSIRYFSKENIPSQLIEKALQLAQTTPSACNRQGWKVHIFSNTLATKLIQWQGGARGFEDEPTLAILVTANSRAFLKYEPFQAYVDGGLYAMNLINALHFVGLGTIPLSCGFGYKKLQSLYTQFGIPENERPILIIGVGQLEDEFKVAISTRKNIANTTTWH